MLNLLHKAKLFHNLTKDEIIELLNSNGLELFSCADNVRKEYKGNSVHLRGLIEFSNVCNCHCFYCGIRCDNKKVERYRLSETQILNCVKFAQSSGYRTVVLQSGEDNFWSCEKLCNLIKKIKEYDVALTLSIGERTFEEYKEFKKFGADRYLIRIETTDENLYNRLHPGMSFQNRLRCLINLKELGYETGTGCLVGLPEQTIESLADDILFFRNLNADMVGIGPFIPHPQTPLAEYKNDNFDLALKVMSITRLLLPDINIPATTAMESLKPNGRIIALNSGANVVMPNLTEVNYRKKYELYPGKICINDSPSDCVKCIKNKIESIGRSVSLSKGYRTDKN